MSPRLRSLFACLSAVALGSFGPGCSHMPVKGEPSADDCAGANSQTTVGTVLGLTGVAAIGTGTGLMLAQRGSEYGSAVGGAAAVVGGVVLGIVGLSMVGAASKARDRCKAAEECRSGSIDACNLLKEPLPPPVSGPTPLWQQ